MRLYCVVVQIEIGRYDRGSLYDNLCDALGRRSCGCCPRAQACMATDCGLTSRSCPRDSKRGTVGQLIAATGGLRAFFVVIGLIANAVASLEAAVREDRQHFFC